MGVFAGCGLDICLSHEEGVNTDSRCCCIFMACGRASWNTFYNAAALFLHRALPHW
jgi:hypothetical protein